MTTSKEQQIENVRLIRRKEVQAKTGLGASSIYAMMKQGEFPKAITLSKRRVAWIESDVDQWIRERIANHKAAIATMESWAMDSMNIHPKVVKTVNHDREIVKLYGAEHQNTMQAFILAFEYLPALEREAVKMTKHYLPEPS